MPSATGRRAASVGAYVLVHLVVLVLLELAARGAVALAGALRPPRPPLAESRHTRYDPDLGWANVPGARIPDMYGSGRDLNVGPQGFRGADDAAAPLPPGWRRMVCSGDSFTFGYGVGDVDAFCARIAARAGNRTCANLAQGGYGLDQAFLRYRREGLGLEHDVHLFAFITEDVVRMESADFLGHGKPLLALQQDRLVVRNVPVPRDASALTPRLRLRAGIERMALVKVMRAGYRRLRPEPAVRLPRPETTDVALAALRELARLDAERRVRLLVVHLPVQEDYADRRRDPWRADLVARAHAGGVEIVDLVPELRKLPASEIPALFIAPGALPYAGAEGHYTERGNEVVAAALAPLVR